MSLSKNDKSELARELSFLVQENEPEALLTRLRQLVVKCVEATAASVEEAKRWHNLGEVLEAADKRLAELNQPSRWTGC